MVTVLRPNVSKVLMMSTLKILSGVVLLIILFLILEFAVRLSVFNEVLKVFGINILPNTLLTLGVATVLILAFIILIYSYLSVMSMKFEFYETKFRFYKPYMLIFRKSENSSYENIAKVNFEKKGFFDDLFNTGSVIMDVSLIGEPHLRIDYVDKPKERCQQIMDIVRAYNLKTQAHYMAKHKRKTLLEDKGL